MNRRYIDFVPVKKDESTAAVNARVEAERAVAESSAGVAEVDDFAVAEIFEEKRVPAGVTQSRTGMARANVVRDVRSAEQSSDNRGRGRLTADVFKVAKRPLGKMNSTGVVSRSTGAVERKEAPSKVPMRAVSRSATIERTTVSRSATTVSHGATTVSRTTVERTEVVAPQKKMQLGVIEDLGPRFVNTEVEKRPLSGGVTAEQSAEQSSAKTGVVSRKKAERELREAKAEKLTGSRGLKRTKLSVADGAMTRAAEQTVSTSGATGVPRVSSALATPRFVNTEKVDKRPLSKNVYAKKVPKSKEEPKGPVTIIAKPERDSQVGMVIAIIITIILGATAGTVAFLLLPK